MAKREYGYDVQPILVGDRLASLGAFLGAERIMA